MEELRRRPVGKKWRWSLGGWKTRWKEESAQNKNEKPWEGQKVKGFEWQAEDLKLTFFAWSHPWAYFLNVIEQNNYVRIGKKLLLTRLEMSGSCRMFDLFLNIHFPGLEMRRQEFRTSVSVILPNLNSSSANAWGKPHAQRKDLEHSEENENMQWTSEKNPISSFIKIKIYPNKITRGCQLSNKCCQLNWCL